jgi:hypothetical protein
MRKDKRDARSLPLSQEEFVEFKFARTLLLCALATRTCRLPYPKNNTVLGYEGLFSL